MPLIIPPHAGETFVDPPESRELAMNELTAHRELSMKAGNLAVLAGTMDVRGERATPWFQPELEDFDGAMPEEILSYQLVRLNPGGTIEEPQPGYTRLFVGMQPGSYPPKPASAQQLEASEQILWITLGVPVEQPFDSIGDDDQKNRGVTVYWPHGDHWPQEIDPNEKLPKALSSDSKHFQDAADTIKWIEGQANLGLPASSTEPLVAHPAF